MIVFALSSVAWTALIVAVGSLASGLLLSQQASRQRRKEKRDDLLQRQKDKKEESEQRRKEKEEDYARQDEVARLAEVARVALIKENKVVADEAARQQAEVAAKAAEQQQQVADVAAGAAQLLKDAQEKTLAGTDEVARLQAGDKSVGGPFPTGPFRAIVVAHPSGYRREALLVTVPAEGQHILLRGTDPDGQPMRVAKILHIEANGGSSPSVVVVVCPLEPGEDGGLAATAVPLP